MGFRVWAICQVPGDHWESGGFSFSTSFLLLLFQLLITGSVWGYNNMDAIICLWPRDRVTGFIHLGPWRITSVSLVDPSLSPGLRPGDSVERAERGGGGCGCGVSGVGSLCSQSQCGFLSSTEQSSPCYVGSSPSSSQFLFRRRYSLSGVKHPTFPFLWNVMQFQRRKQVLEKETLRMVECFNHWLKFWVK